MSCVWRFCYGKKLPWLEGIDTGYPVASASNPPMKFDELYPDAQPGIPPARNVVLALHEDQERPCVACGEVTRWFHRAECVNSFETATFGI